MILVMDMEAFKMKRFLLMLSLLVICMSICLCSCSSNSNNKGGVSNTNSKKADVLDGFWTDENMTTLVVDGNEAYINWGGTPYICTVDTKEKTITAKRFSWDQSDSVFSYEFINGKVKLDTDNDQSLKDTVVFVPDEDAIQIERTQSPDGEWSNRNMTTVSIDGKSGFLTWGGTDYSLSVDADKKIITVKGYSWSGKDIEYTYSFVQGRLLMDTENYDDALGSQILLLPLDVAKKMDKEQEEKDKKEEKKEDSEEEDAEIPNDGKEVDWLSKEYVVVSLYNKKTKKTTDISGGYGLIVDNSGTLVDVNDVNDNYWGQEWIDKDIDVKVKKYGKGSKYITVYVNDSVAANGENLCIDGGTSLLNVHPLMNLDEYTAQEWLEKDDIVRIEVE